MGDGAVSDASHPLPAPPSQVHYNSLYHLDEAPTPLEADDSGDEGGSSGPLLGSQRLRGLVDALRGGNGGGGGGCSGGARSPVQVIHIE